MDATQVAGRCLSPQYGFCMQDADSGSDRPDVPLALERNPTSESSWPSPSSFFLSDIPWLHSGRNASSFPSSLVKSEDVLAHIREISDDRYEGRDSPSRGLDLAADYIRGVAEMYGLRGAGPDSSFYQSFSIYGFSPHGAYKSPSAAGGKGRAPDSYGPKLFEYAVHEDELEVRKSQTPAAKMNFFKWGKANNVVGVLEGSDSKLKDEYIMVSAHYDHIGTRSRGEDRIYNGADDNASGSAVLMGILPALKEMAKRGMGPKRSVIFIWTAAEEKGLLGADYYRRHPLRPISKTKAAINVDMVARLSADRISVCDIDRKGKPSFFRQLLSGAALAAGFNEVRHDIDEYLDRQDGGVWAAAGIPTAFLFEGFTSRGRLNPDYHGVDDEYDAIISDNGGEKAVRVARMTLELLLAAANR